MVSSTLSALSAASTLACATSLAVESLAFLVFFTCQTMPAMLPPANKALAPIMRAVPQGNSAAGGSGRAEAGAASLPARKPRAAAQAAPALQLCRRSPSSAGAACARRRRRSARSRGPPRAARRSGWASSAWRAPPQASRWAHSSSAVSARWAPPRLTNTPRSMAEQDCPASGPEADGVGC